MSFDYFSKQRMQYILTKLKVIFDTKANIGDVVTGVKGDSESSYRKGNVNVTKSNIGLGNVGNFLAVSTAANQNLTNDQKSNARTNIGAGTSNLALGETSSTAYRGDRGKTAYDHSQVTSGNPHNVTKSDVGLGNVGNFKAVSTVASQGLTDTEKSNARTNIGAGTSNFSGAYADLTGKPTISTVNNGTLTIQKNGTNVQTFTANQSGNATANITVPTKVSELSNDSGYTTNTGTITGIKMNGASKGTSGVVDLGTVITAHQDISGKANTADLGDGAYKNSGVYYGTCATAAATKDKVVSVSADQKFTLKVGAVVHVKFTNSNTYSATADNKITLNVNSTGAKNIYYRNGYPTGTTDNTAFGAANYIMSYMYNGTDWVWVGFSGENNTTYNFSGTTFYSGNKDNSEHNANNAIKNGHYYYTSNGPATSLGATTNDGALYVQAHSDSWVGQIAQDYRNGALFVRGKNNGTWQNWQRVYDTAHKPTASDVGLGNVGNFKAVSTVASQGLTDTEKSNARANIGAGTSSFSGNYNDLSNKPTIPTVNNGTLTIQKNGTNVQTFTANQSGNATANITVPTKTSDITNDSGFISYKAVSTVASQGLTDTEKSNARANIGAGTGSGTITGITMNGASKGTSGVVDLGTVITSHQDISGKVNKSGDTMTGALTMSGSDLKLGTTVSSSDDSGDIAWFYGNGQEKARLWTQNDYTAESGLNFRMYKKDGTNLFTGTIPLRNTTYTFDTGNANGQIKVTPSGGTAQNISVKGLGTAAYTESSAYAAASHNHTINQVTWPGNQNLLTSATANNQEWSIDLGSSSYTGCYFHVWSGKNGKSILSCYNDDCSVVIPNGPLTVSGLSTFKDTLSLYKEGTTANNYPAQLKFKLKDTTTGQTYDNAYIAAYQDHQSTTYGTNMVIHSGGGMFLGSGESPAAHYSTKGAAYAGEDTFLTSDGTAHLQANGNNIANRVGFMINTSGYLIPEKVDAATNGIGGLGNSSYRVKDIYSQSFNNLITGSGTTAQDKGSGVSPRYFPAKWTFNIGRAPVDGDIITIKIPCAGHDYGVFVSINNGTNYHPVRRDYGTGRLTTHFGSGQYITLIYTPNATCNSIYAVAGADARSNITGCWTVLNWYDSNNIPSVYCSTGGGTAAKWGDCSGYIAKNPSYVQVMLVNANTVKGAITLNINSQGAKPIYINGSASSASNYTLPAGPYLVYYNGTNYYFRTDGKITGAGMVDIGGNTGKFLRGDGTWQTVITSHQDISGKADKSTTVSTVDWDSTNKKITKTINGNTSDVVTAATILGNLTKSQVTTALGYTPPTEDTKVQQTTDSATNSTFPLLGGTSLDTDSADYVKKFYNIRVNPSLSSLSVGGGSAIASGQLSFAHGLATMLMDGEDFITRYTTASGDGSYAGGAGCIASGASSHAEGYGTTASGGNSHAEGSGCTASGGCSHAEGLDTTARGSSSHAEGSGCTASGDCSHAEGLDTTASGAFSHAEGMNTTASKNNSHAEGYGTTASGGSSHAEGSGCTASGDCSHAEGLDTTASEGFSHAEGFGCTASGSSSHAEGRNTLASGWSSHAGGIDVAAYGDCAFIHGNGPSSSDKLKTSQYTFLFGNCQNNKFRSTNLNNCDGFVFSGSFQNAEYDSDTALGYTAVNSASGVICNTATITIQITKGAMYVLFCSSYTISSGAIYGSIASLITAHALDTGTPNKVDMGKTSNAAATISVAANNKITIKNGAATRVTQFHLMRVL